MIPYASQRGGGQDLATHLMNAHDNESLELVDVRGAVARDLHGAFAEWEAQAKALTRCHQYLCSLSINPDELQGRLTRAQYLDYIERAESRLGLSGQPRAIIFHIKEDERGRMREHCHAVWSRIDAERAKAVPLSFFKERMMTVTREFARDHGLELPKGYHRQEDELRRRDRQLTGYDCIKQKETGISHEDRMAAVTDAWRRSDNGRTFVNALEDLGYVLACGRNGTRVVLVDFYGHTTALTRLIDDATVRARHVRAFLGGDYAPENLPSVEQAQALIAERCALIEAFEQARMESEQVAELVRQQAARRKELEGEARALRQRQHEERTQLAAKQKTARQVLKTSYLAALKRIRIERARRRPKGLAAFLGRVTGVALITRKVQRYRDQKRYSAYVVWREELRRQQRAAQQELAARHDLQMANIQRRLRALDQVEQRERDSAEQATRKERRQRINARHEHMPSVAPAPNARKQQPALSEANQRRDAAIARELAEAAQLLKEGRKPIRLTDAFAKASVDEEETGDTGAAQPAPKRDKKKRVRRRASLRRDFRQAASGDQDEGDAGDSDSSAANTTIHPTPSRRHRRKRPRSEKGQATGGERSGEDQREHNRKEARKDERQRRRRRRRDLDPGM